jgi:hypothetical protein
MPYCAASQLGITNLSSNPRASVGTYVPWRQDDQSTAFSQLSADMMRFIGTQNSESIDLECSVLAYAECCQVPIQVITSLCFEFADMPTYLSKRFCNASIYRAWKLSALSPSFAKRGSPKAISKSLHRKQAGLGKDAAYGSRDSREDYNGAREHSEEDDVFERVLTTGNVIVRGLSFLQAVATARS